MFKWLRLDEAAKMILAATGEDVGQAELLEDAFAGKLAIAAVIPDWTAPGCGDLVFYAADGGRIGSATEAGVFRHLSKYDFQTMHTRGKLALAGRRVELPDATTGGVIEAFVGPDAPIIDTDDLRISEAEIKRFIGSRAKALRRMPAEYPVIANGTHAAAPSISGLVLWQAALLDAWPTIVAELGSNKPPARGVMRWLKKSGPRDVFPLEQPNFGSLRWLDSAGDPQTVTLSSIGNRISEWRRDKRIPV